MRLENTIRKMLTDYRQQVRDETLEEVAKKADEMRERYANRRDDWTKGLKTACSSMAIEFHGMKSGSQK